MRFGLLSRCIAWLSGSVLVSNLDQSTYYSTSDAIAVKRMKIFQYCQRQRCRHVELKQFWQAFASRGFVSDSWDFLLR